MTVNLMARTMVIMVCHQGRACNDYIKIRCFWEVIYGLYLNSDMITI